MLDRMFGPFPDESNYHIKWILITTQSTSYRMNVSYYRQILNQDSKTDPFILITTLACCCLSGAFSVTGNGMVLFLICRSRSFRNNATFIFIANICVSDIMISTLVVPFQFQIHLLKRWVMPAFLCYACLTVQTLMVSNSVFTLTAIALERYRAILNPLKTRLSKGQVKIEIAIIWLLSFLTCIPTFFSYNVSLLMNEQIWYLIIWLGSNGNGPIHGTTNIGPMCDQGRFVSILLWIVDFNTLFHTIMYHLLLLCSNGNRIEWWHARDCIRIKYQLFQIDSW